MGAWVFGPDIYYCNQRASILRSSGAEPSECCCRCRGIATALCIAPHCSAMLYVARHRCALLWHLQLQPTTTSWSPLGRLWSSRRVAGRAREIRARERLYPPLSQTRRSSSHEPFVLCRRVSLLVPGSGNAFIKPVLRGSARSLETLISTEFSLPPAVLRLCNALL